MTDPRLSELARILISHSCQVQPGETVLIETFDVPDEAAVALVRAVANAGGLPLCVTKRNRVLRELYRNATVQQMAALGAIESHQMQHVQAYIGVRGADNSTEHSDVPQDRLSLYAKHVWEPVHIKLRVAKTKWVVLRWPTPATAQQARMSTEAFEDYFFDVCTVDYAQMRRALEPLEERMQAARNVHITGPGTDLSFSIADIPVVACAGRRNIPDGEIFTSPVRDSVEGTLRVNTQSLYHGTVFEGIELDFRAGKVVAARANHSDRIQQILDTDPGARYVGEFSLGVNPRILHPMLDTLFDEKIAGSFHFTPGQAYDEADNGNRSAVHWDLVTIQRAEYGGGEISFDGKVIRKDGRFLAPELAGLNPA